MDSGATRISPFSDDKGNIVVSNELVPYGSELSQNSDIPSIQKLVDSRSVSVYSQIKQPVLTLDEVTELDQTIDRQRAQKIMRVVKSTQKIMNDVMELDE